MDPRALGLQYQSVLRQLRDSGEWVFYERVNQECLALPPLTLTYHLDFQEIRPGVYKFKIPLDTTRKSFGITAFLETLGYARGYNSAAQFRDFGVPTWNANANENEAWLNNPNRKGHDDMGRVYGVQGRGWRAPDGKSIDQVKKIMTNLENGIDDRGEIINYYNIGEFHLGCLRPCLYDFQFTLINGKLYLLAKQRSCDFLLGGNFNGPQVVGNLALFAISSGHTPVYATHAIANTHIYRSQYDLFIESGHADREPYNDPYMVVDTTLPHTAGKTGLDLLLSLDRRNFEVIEYESYSAISYPMIA